MPKVSWDDYRELISDMSNDQKDRHVLAAAIAIQADMPVTANLKDFNPLPDDCEVEIQHPDDFLCAVLENSPTEVFGTLKDLTSRRHSTFSPDTTKVTLHRPPDWIMEWGELPDLLQDSLPYVQVDYTQYSCENSRSRT